MLFNQPRNATCTALDTVSLVKIARADFEQMLAGAQPVRETLTKVAEARIKANQRKRSRDENDNSNAQANYPRFASSSIAVHLRRSMRLPPSGSRVDRLAAMKTPRSTPFWLLCTADWSLFACISPIGTHSSCHRSTRIMSEQLGQCAMRTPLSISARLMTNRSPLFDSVRSVRRLSTRGQRGAHRTLDKHACTHQGQL